MSHALSADRRLDAYGAKAATACAVVAAKADEPFWQRARRNRLLAAWFSDLTDESTQSYLRLLLDADFAKIENAASERWILLKMRNDLMGFGVFLTPAQMEDEMARLNATAALG